MVKVLLVEDDNNLREIFAMRLQAEGYKTISASDGEEALVVAVKEKPDLIIADIMMPKLSGFEMVENMRAAPELANVKVIMMTALGQAEDRARGEKLGVVKYLVKSQVTLEDFVRVVREVLPPDGSSPQSSNAATPPNTATTNTGNINKQESEQTMQDDTQTPTNPTPPADPGIPPTPTEPSAQVDGSGGATDNPIASPPADGGISDSGQQQTTAQEESTVSGQINDFANDPTAGSTGGASDATPPAPTASTPPADGSAPELPAAPADPTAPPSNPSSPVSPV